MARKVNTKFLTVLTLVVVGGLVAMGAIAMVAKSGNTKKYIAQGHEALKAGDIDTAIQRFVDALRGDPNNLDVQVALGDALHEKTRTAPEYVRKDTAAWERVLEADPQHKAALQRLMAAYLDYVEIQPSRDSFTRLKATADKLAKADPSDIRGQIYRPISVIGGWLAGTATQSDVVQSSIEELDKLMAAHPEESQIPYYLGRAYVKLGVDLRNGQRVTEAEEMYKKAIAVMDQAIKNRPDDALMHFRYYQVLQAVADPDGEGAIDARYLDGLGKCMENVQRLAKTGNPMYREMQTAGIEFTLRQGKIADAEKMARDLVDKVPDDQAAKLVLATVLRAQPDKRGQVIELLKQPVKDDPSLVGFRVWRRLGFESQRLMLLAETQIEACAESTDPGVKQQLRKDVEDCYKALTAQRSEDDPPMLQLKARMLLLEDNAKSAVASIQLLQKAYDRERQFGRSSPQLVFMLANAYMGIQETGHAKTLLTELTRRIPSFAPAQKKLVQLLLQEGKLEDARPRLDALEKLTPDDPDLIRFRLVYVDVKSDPRKRDELLAKLPETTDAQIWTKAKMAYRTGSLTMAETLLKKLTDKDEYLVSATRLLAAMLVANGREADANAAIKTAREKKPNDSVLKILEKTTAKASPEEIEEVINKAIEEIKDPVDRELRLYALAHDRGQNDEAIVHLKKAEEMGRDDSRVHAALFDWNIEQKNWDEAGRVADKLAKADADNVGGRTFRIRLALTRGQAAEAQSLANELIRWYPEFSRSWVALAQAQELSGAFDQARDSYSKALEKHSKSPEALLGLIQCSYRLGQPDAAANYIRLATEALPGNDLFRQFELAHREQYGDPLVLIPDWEKMAAANPEAMQIQLGLGRLYLRAAKKKAESSPAQAAPFYAKARQALQQAKTKWPDERLAYALLAELALSQQNVDESISVLREMAARDAWKGKPDVPLAIGETYARLGRMTEAEAAYQEAAQKGADPQRIVNFYLQTGSQVQGNFDKAIALLQKLAEGDDQQLLRQLADAQVRADKWADARQTVDRALKKYAQDADIIAIDATLLANDKKFAQAMARVAEALKIDPKSVRANFLRGLIALQNNDLATAMESFQVAAERDPGNVEVHLRLAEVYRKRGSAVDVVKELRTAYQIAPLRRDIRLQLAQIAMAAAMWADVDTLLGDCQSNPLLAREAVWWQLHAQSLVQRNKLPEAMEKAAQAMRLAPDNPELRVQYAEILAGLKKYTEAMQALDPLLKDEKSPSYWRIRALAGRIRGGLNDKDAALADLDAALALAPDDASTAQVVQWLVDIFGPNDAMARLAQLGQSDSKWRLMLAGLEHQQGDSAKAAATLDALFQDPQYAQWPLQRRLSAFRLAGNVFLAAGIREPMYCEKSRQVYVQYLEQAPVPQNDETRMGHVMVLNNLATLLVDQITPAQPQQAEKYTRQAVQLMDQMGQRNAAVLDTHGWVLLQAGKVDEAIEVLSEAADRDATLVDAAYHLGAAYLKKKVVPLSRGSLDRAMQLLNDRKTANIPGDSQMRSKVEAALEDVAKLDRSQRDADK